MVRKGEYPELLSKDTNLKRWHENLIRGSPITAAVYLRRLGAFCKQLGLTPSGFIELEQREMENALQDYVNSLERQGKAPGYLKSILKAVRSWSEWNGKKIQRRIKLANGDSTPTLDDEITPSKEELRKVLYSDKTPLRTRAAIALVAFSGVRLESLGDYFGHDGLKLKDLNELKIGETLQFEKIPTLLTIRLNLSKGRHKYPTFLAQEGCTIILELLQRRREAGEKLTPDTPLIGTSPFYDKRGRFSNRASETRHIRTSKIGEHMRQAMRAAGLPQRPYVWRSYFDTAMLLGERVISHTYAQVLMGHKVKGLDIEAIYTVRKSRLPARLLEDIRQSYEKCEEFLVTVVPETPSMEKMKKAFKEEWLGLFLNKEEIQKLNLEEITNEELLKIASERLLGTGAKQPHPDPQIIIEEKALEKYLREGWHFVSALHSGNVIVGK